MKVVEVRASKTYQVLIGRGLLDQAGELLRAVAPAKTAVIAAGEYVFPLYGERLRASLESEGFRVLSFVHPSGEEHKTLESFAELVRFLARNRVSRSDLLLSLGGGVTGDLAGFAAACYQRGMAYAQIPTSLLAMVDSSVGGKTGVDLPEGKNLVGCFCQPSLVLCDPDLLSTLPWREFRCGCAELVKYAVLRGGSLYESLLSPPLDDRIEEVIGASLAIKRDLVAEDEFDWGSRRLLNLGHTIGHAVERCSDYRVPHGEAVSVGMAVMTRAAVNRGICGEDTLDALLRLLRAYELPTETDIPARRLADAILSDKKRVDGTIALVVPEAIGSCRILELAADELPVWLKQGGVHG